MPFYYYYDPTYILVIIGAVISMLASLNVNMTFAKYKKVGNAANLTAQDVAMKILHDAGIYDVRIERIGGKLTDHYSPGEKVLRLSDSVYNSTSVAAIGVAAHECGHAIQHQVGYTPLVLRTAAVPAARFGSFLSLPLIIIGLMMDSLGLAEVGVILFIAVVAFELITLPVEFDASRRAVKILGGSGVLGGGELKGAKKVLKAAALTYVAALFASILQLIRLIMIVQGSSRRD